jgi:ubiquinone/menaquinone biosynthesis C-methylase UbiE
LKQDASRVIQTQTGETLCYLRERDTEFFKSPDGSRFIIKNDILCFINNKPLTGNNGNYQKMYDRFARFYDYATSVYAFFKNGNEKKRVMQYLSSLEINNGDYVIEISIGTGRNIKYLNPQAEYFGIDISFEMLKRCRDKMKRLKREISLIQAEAEFLPIKNETFDVVFSAGGFNFFNDPGRAVNEMLRIAKRGSKILISDETEKLRQKYSKNEFYDNSPVKNPTDYLPDYCKNIEYKEICDGDLYVLTFVKP